MVTYSDHLAQIGGTSLTVDYLCSVMESGKFASAQLGRDVMGAVMDALCDLTSRTDNDRAPVLEHVADGDDPHHGLCNVAAPRGNNGPELC